MDIARSHLTFCTHFTISIAAHLNISAEKCSADNDHNTEWRWHRARMPGRLTIVRFRWVMVLRREIYYAAERGVRVHILRRTDKQKNDFAFRARKYYSPIEVNRIMCVGMPQTLIHFINWLSDLRRMPKLKSNTDGGKKRWKFNAKSKNGRISVSHSARQPPRTLVDTSRSHSHAHNL